MRPDGNVEVRCKVENIGDRESKEVVQLYLRTNSRVITMPLLDLRAGEERDVRFTLGPADVAHLTPALERIVEETGYEIMVGASSEDIRLRGKFQVKQ